MRAKTVFAFTHFDYCFPPSLLVNQAIKSETVEELLEYPEAVIRKASESNQFSEFLFQESQPSLKLSRILNKDIKIPKTLPARMLKEVIKHDQYKELMRPKVLESLSRMMDEEVATVSNVYGLELDTPLRHNNLDNFEDIYHIILWKKHQTLSIDTNSWLLKQSESVLYKGKLDLDSISKAYAELCADYWDRVELWGWYHGILKDHFNSLVPSQICRVCKGYALVYKYLTKEPGIPVLLSQLTKEHLDDFTPAELIEIARYMIELHVNVPEYVKSRIMSEERKKGNDFIYYALHSEFGKTVIDSAIDEIYTSGTPEDRCELLGTIVHFKKFRESAERISKKLSLELESLSNESLLGLLEIIGTEERTIDLRGPVISRIEEILPRCKIADLTHLAKAIGVFIHQGLDFTENCTNLFSEAFLRNLNQVNFRNFSYFVHVFSYILPNKIAHDTLCNLILQTQIPSYVEESKPSHGLFYAAENGKFVVLNHPILSNMMEIQLADTLACIKMRFQVPENVNNILEMYTKAVLENMYFNLNAKFRTKIAIMLARPENFNKELVDLLFTQVEKSIRFGHREIYSYTIAAYIQNFQKLDYYHPLMDQISKI